MTPTEFTHRTLPHVGRPVHRQGLALNDGLDPRGFDLAVERGLNAFAKLQRTGFASWASLSPDEATWMREFGAAVHG
jgi:hypothetical protein